ncbi:MAG: hypothetical protein EBU29_12865 [Gammaproteobacteria bacterium]|nr:hypothetical protein [Gammaproteobacteria bacterium]
MTDLFLDAPVPRPPRRPVAQDVHGEHWEDPYAWLRDDAFPPLTDSTVKGHLEAENRYTDAVLAPLAPLKQALRDQLAFPGAVPRAPFAGPFPKGLSIPAGIA